MDEKVVKRNWFRTLSPAVVGIFFSIIVVISSMASMEKSGGWSFIGVLMIAPIAMILLVMDILLKWAIKTNTAVIWVIELAAMAAAILYLMPVKY